MQTLFPGRSEPLRHVFDKAPLRVIANQLGAWVFVKRGERVGCILECGHYLSLSRTEMREKRHHCFDCFYGKPALDPIQAEKFARGRAE